MYGNFKLSSEPNNCLILIPQADEVIVVKAVSGGRMMNVEQTVQFCMTTITRPVNSETKYLAEHLSVSSK